MPPFNDIAPILAVNLGLALAAFALLWGLAIAIRDVTFIDAGWGLGLAAMGLATFLQTEGAGQRRAAILVLVGVWGLRLGGYMLWRWRNHGPDQRYVEMLARGQAGGAGFARASAPIFGVQAVLLWIVSLPVQIGQIGQISGQISETPAAVGVIGWIGLGLAAFGILFESLGDWQMVRFKADAANRGQVMDRGLWRYTQHPNYFGDLCVWFGLWLVAAETGLWGVASIVGPVLLLTMFLKVSGGVSYSKRLKTTRPGYADYMARTSPLIPWPPKEG